MVLLRINLWAEKGSPMQVITHLVEKTDNLFTRKEMIYKSIPNRFVLNVSSLIKKKNLKLTAILSSTEHKLNSAPDCKISQVRDLMQHYSMSNDPWDS